MNRVNSEDKLITSIAINFLCGSNSEVINVFRKILKHAQDINDNVCFMAPFAVICDGLDAEGTIAMGLHKIQNYLKWFKIKCKGNEALLV